MKIEIDDSDLAAILGGLRLLQRAFERDDLDMGIFEIVNGCQEPLALDGIDDLCERLNTAEDGAADIGWGMVVYPRGEHLVCHGEHVVHENCRLAVRSNGDIVIRDPGLDATVVLVKETLVERAREAMRAFPQGKRRAYPPSEPVGPNASVED